MKNLEIKCLHCSDYLDFNAMKPGEVDSFHIPFEIEVGEVGGEVAYSYQISVVSPDEIKIVTDQYYIITPLFDPKSITSILFNIVEYCNTTHDPYLNLEKYFRWKYEGYMRCF